MQREASNNQISRSSYYQELRELALLKRAQYRIDTATLNLTVIRRIYKAEGITIDNWTPKRRRIRAAYFCDDDDYSVMVDKNLPREPRLFALVHELKHHYVDQEIIKNGEIRCGAYNANELIEKGAEVFAAEFIYPEDEMLQLLNVLGMTAPTSTPEQIVEFKRACRACVSYTFIRKRFEWFELIPPKAYSRIQFQKLEEQMYGVPFYMEPEFKAARKRKALKNN